MKTLMTVLAALLLLSGCAGSGEPTITPVEKTPISGEARKVLVTITTSSDDHNVVSSRNVLCSKGSVSGSHPDAEGACEVLRTVDLDVFEPVAEDTMCTEQYGGPERGEIRGEIDGVKVDAEFSRGDGCEIARWDALEGVWHDPLG